MAKIKKITGKKGATWQIDYIDPHGKRIRHMFKKRKDAAAELGKRVSLMAEGRYLDVKKDYKTTLGELIEKYEENFNQQAAYKKYKAYCMENYKVHFGEETKLASVRYVDLETYRTHLSRKLTRHGTVRKVASVNREIACLHHLFTKGVEWELMEKNPFDKGKGLIQKENNKRYRFLTEDEIEKLLDECEGKKHLHRIVECALNTGMRRNEILSLKWAQVKDGLIYLQEKVKNNEARQIPINDRMNEIFKEIRKEQGLSSKHVFTYQHGKKSNPVPIHRVDRSFKGALSRAKIEDCKFHDLRHTFASHLVMRGATLREVQELLGHTTVTMTLRYSHLSPEHKQKAVDRLNGLTASGGTQCQKSDRFLNSRVSANG